MGNRLFDHVRDHAVRMYLRGDPWPEIETSTGAARRTVLTWVKAQGHETRGIQRVDPRVERRAVELYRKGWKVEDICEVLGISRGHVKTLRRRAGVPPRRPGGR